MALRILDAVKTYDVSNVGYAKVCNADLLLATDPDCDRVGIAVKNKAVEYELLTGNQTDMLLDYAPDLDGLPKSLLEDNGSLVVRPSGTSRS